MSEATKLKVCPILTAGTAQTPGAASVIATPGTPPETPMTKVWPVQCLGPECQFWTHDERGAPELGNCALPLGAVFSGMAAVETASGTNNLLAIGRMMERVMKKLGIEVEPPAEPVKQ